MCGRYEFNILPDKTGKQIYDKALEMSLDFKQGEIFPNDNVLCIIPYNDLISLSVKKWGIKSKYFMINARIESVNTSSFYQNMRNKRCAIIANGFYEWDYNSNKYYFHTEDDYIYLAAIYNDLNELLILTKPSDDSMNNIHDRMPIIMNKIEMLDYLNNKEYNISYKHLYIIQGETK